LSATPDVEELSCREKPGVESSAAAGRGGVGGGHPPAGEGSIGSGSGKRSLEVISEKAAVEAGVCRSIGVRCFARVAGCRLQPRAGVRAYLSFTEREEIASCSPAALGCERSPVGSSRTIDNLPRAATQRCDRTRRVEYRASTAHRHDERRAQRPKPAKLAVTRGCGPMCRTDFGSGAAARRSVRGSRYRMARARQGPRKDRRWGQCWSPEQNLRPPPPGLPDDESMRISHERSINRFYIQGRGALRREIYACLRTGRALRAPRTEH